MNKKCVLITGGAGYIGSQTVYHLLDNGFEVIALDNFSKGSRSILQHTGSHCQIVDAELQDRSQIDEVFTSHPEISAVVHCAASIAVGESVENPSLYYNNNVVSTINLLDSMVKHNIESLIFSSTAATYGVPERVPITETDRQLPINPYGNTKLAMEWLIADYVRAYNLKATIFRYFNACGADLQARTGHTADPATHLIPIVLDVLEGKREQLLINGDDYDTKDGTCVRDYVHTLDIADAHLKAVEALSTASVHTLAQYNLGTDTGYSVKEILHQVETISRKQIPHTTAPRRPGDPDILIADNTKARTELNWQPQYSDLQSIIESEIQWRAENRA